MKENEQNTHLQKTQQKENCEWQPKHEGFFISPMN